MLSNVVVVTDFAYIDGGAGKVALTSAEALATRGYRVILFAAVSPTADAPAPKGVQLICTGQQDISSDSNRFRSFRQGLWNGKAAREMENLLDGLDPACTILHVHNWTRALSSSPIRVAIQKGFKVVCTLHDYFSACPNGGLYNFQKHEICTLKPMSGACLKTNCDARSYPQKLWRVTRQVIQKEVGGMPGALAHFIAVSDFSSRVLRPYLPAEAKVHRVSNPISIHRNAAIDVAGNESFVMVGRLSQEKGAPLFAEAVQSLGFDGVIVGDGVLAETLKARFPEISYEGWLEPEKVEGVLRCARCLVLPSTWYETQGMVVLEAAALGVPALVPDTSAARDLVEDGETGLWFKGGDLSDLQEKMHRIHQDPALAARLGQAAYEKFWQNPPSIDRHVQELLAVYQQILAA